MSNLKKIMVLMIALLAFTFVIWKKDYLFEYYYDIVNKNELVETKLGIDSILNTLSKVKYKSRLI